LLSCSSEEKSSILSDEPQSIYAISDTEAKTLIENFGEVKTRSSSLTPSVQAGERKSTKIYKY
jgi:hypothetical protein